MPENYPQSGGTSQETENDVHARGEGRGAKRDYRRGVERQEVGTGDRVVELPVLPGSHKDQGGMEGGRGHETCERARCRRLLTSAPDRGSVGAAGNM